MKTLVDPDGLVHEDDTITQDHRNYTSLTTLCERWTGEAYTPDELRPSDASVTTCLWCVVTPGFHRGKKLPDTAAHWRFRTRRRH